MVTHDRFLYVFGGAADSTLPNDLHCFDLDSQVWSVIIPAPESQVPSGRLFHAAAVIGDALYIFGGTIDNNVRSGDMYRFQFSRFPKCSLHDDFGKFLSGRQFCDVQFIVGPDETKIPAHIAIIVARSQYLRSKILAARDARNIHFEKLFGTTEVPFAESPLLEVKLSSAQPEAFELVLRFIYTDRIDCKYQKININSKYLLIFSPFSQRSILAKNCVHNDGRLPTGHPILHSSPRTALCSIS